MCPNPNLVSYLDDKFFSVPFDSLQFNWILEIRSVNVPIGTMFFNFGRKNYQVALDITKSWQATGYEKIVNHMIKVDQACQFPFLQIPNWSVFE